MVVSQIHSFTAASSQLTVSQLTTSQLTALQLTALQPSQLTVSQLTASQPTASQLFRFPRRSLSTCSHALARLPGTFFGPGHTSLMIPDLPHSKRLMSIFALNFGPQREHHLAAFGSSGSSLHVGNCDTVLLAPSKLQSHFTWQMPSINGWIFEGS